MEKTIGFMLRKLSRYVKHNMFHRIGDATNHQVTHIQARVLCYLEWKQDEKEVVYQKNIEEFLSVSKSTASELISNLEKNEYISRVKEESDGRMRKIVLLEKGYKTNKLIGETIQNFENEMKNKLSQEEIDIFYSIIDKIIN